MGMRFPRLVSIVSKDFRNGEPLSETEIKMLAHIANVKKAKFDGEDISYETPTSDDVEKMVSERKVALIAYHTTKLEELQ